MEQFKHRKSYQYILKSAKELFMKFGIKKVSVEEICKNAPVSKMTFYRMFKNKRELVVELLDSLFTKWLNDYKNIMNLDVPFSEKIKQLVLLEHENSEGISHLFITEIYQSDDTDLQKIVDTHKGNSTNEIYKDFLDAQKQGWIRNDIKIESILYFLNLIDEKIVDPNYIKLHNNMHDAIMEITNFFFYGVASKTN